MTDVTIFAPLASPNTNMRVMATTTTLQFSPDGGTTWSAVNSAAGATWTSQTGTSSCISQLSSVSKSFQVYCTDTTQYQFSGQSKTWQMRYITSYTQVSGIPASPQTIIDNFTLTISLSSTILTCTSDALQLITSTSAKTAYAGVTLTNPGINYLHGDGFTDASCPVTVTYYVSSDAGATWKSSGTVFTNLISSTNNGALVIIPSVSAFGSGTSTSSMLVKVLYTLQATGVAIVD
jgi:hypothetical protein